MSQWMLRVLPCCAVRRLSSLQGRSAADNRLHRAHATHTAHAVIPLAQFPATLAGTGRACLFQEQPGGDEGEAHEERQWVLGQPQGASQACGAGAGAEVPQRRDGGRPQRELAPAERQLGLQLRASANAGTASGWCAVPQ